MPPVRAERGTSTCSIHPSQESECRSIPCGARWARRTLAETVAGQEEQASKRRRTASGSRFAGAISGEGKGEVKRQKESGAERPLYKSFSPSARKGLMCEPDNSVPASSRCRAALFVSMMEAGALAEFAHHAAHHAHGLLPR